MQEGGSAMSQRSEARPAALSATTTQAGEVLGRWLWTEPAVWTERMLTALENGVKGGVWFSLIDKVYSPATLATSLRSVLRRRQGKRGRGRGLDHQRWPNAFFAEQGLFSLRVAHVLACQSSSR